MADDTDDKTLLMPPPSASFKKFLADTGQPSPQQYEAKEKQIVEEHKTARQPFIDESDRLMKQTIELNETMAKIKPPKAPELKKLPEAPDTEYQDPTKALGGLGSVLAIFGSLKTRAPMTAALNSAAASMKGFHEGDVQRAELEHTKWKDNLEKAMRQNQEEIQEYTRALEEKKFDISRVQGQFSVIAAQNQHNQMKAAIEAGDFQAQMQLLDANRQSGLKMAQLLLTDQEKKVALFKCNLPKLSCAWILWRRLCGKCVHCFWQLE